MQALRDNFENELDYRREAAWQQRYHRLAAPLEDIVVPRVVPEHVRDNVLVQTWEPGLSLEDASRLPAEERFNFGRALLRQYLFMLFRHGIAHADPNPGNFAFRVGGEGPPQVVVYDYGSVFEITRDERMTLLRTLLALQAREAVDPAACLAGLGFDVEKLKDVRPCLAALLGVLFEPFLVDRPFDVNDWDINQRFDAIVGELKWWFRSAAPPRMIFLMRALHGLTSHLKKLDVRLIWRRVLDEVGSDLFRQAMSFPLPPPPPGGNGETNFRSLSQYLKVHVEKCNGNKVELTMPARVVDELEDVIDPPVLATIRDNGIELEVIKRQVQRSGYAPQTLFQVKDPERDVRVWLE
ncbi:MAG: AarF/UbiB family protein, partial [Nitrospinaceae bacterium]